MIHSFADKALESLYYEGSSRKTKRLPADLQRVIIRKRAYLSAAISLDDLRAPPANHLEALKGDLKG